MALDDNEVIDRALDAAEARMKEGSADEAPETAVTESAVEASKAQEPAQETQTERPRDESGKFTKAEKAAQKLAAKSAEAEPAATDLSDQKANVEAAEDAPQGEAPQGQASVELPAFWSSEEKAVVAKAPREVLEIISRKEAQRNEWANRIAREAEGSRATLTQLDEVYAPHRAKLQANGIPNLVEANRRLLAWSEMFESDLKGTVTALLQRNGLTPHDLLEDAQNTFNPSQQQFSDPRVEQALEKAEAAERQLKEFQENQTRSQAEAELNAFKQGKDSFGQTRAQFVEAYEPQIGQALATIRQQYPQLSKTEALHHAYEFTLKQVRELHGLTSAPQVTAKPAPVPAAKAKAAASSVTGAPASGKSASVRPRAKTIDEALDRAEEQLGLR